jgi:GNAT superfamily N-acetyltransferase
MKSDCDYLRTINRNEFEHLLELAHLEDWNPGIYDADSFYNTDPDGFIGYYVKGKLAGCISAVAYDEDFGFMGFYIVKPEYRGLGYGKKLCEAAIGYLGNGNIGIDGLIAMKDKYANFGFKLAYQNNRYKVIAHPIVFDDNTQPLKNTTFNQLSVFDHLHFPTRRDVFLYNWIHQPEGQGYVVLTKDDKIDGFIYIRKCFEGYKVGPLFALTPKSAKTLLCKAISTLPEGTPLFIDVPEVNADAVKLVSELAEPTGFSTVRMYSQKTPEFNIKGVYGVTSCELG